jgi:glycosyltransferase involved in cell wall biosynthesis
MQQVSNLCANVIVANSNLVLKDVLQTERSLPKRSTVIPNGVDLPIELADVGVEPPRGLVVANLIAYKGHKDLIDALFSIDAPPSIMFVGEGPERQRLEELVAIRGLDKTISFAGRHIGARQLFHNVQFAVQPSHEEGMPNAVLEAMSYGVPVIATSVGGIPELIEDGIDGLLVTSHAPEEIAAALILLCDNPDMRRRLGLRAREKAATFSWDLCAERHLDLYAELLQRRRFKSGMRVRIIRFCSPIGAWKRRSRDVLRNSFSKQDPCAD